MIPTKDVVRFRDDGNKFFITVDDEIRWTCERETLADGRRGYWLLYLNGPFGRIQVDRDQYSNDILERVDIYENADAQYLSTSMSEFVRTVEEAKNCIRTRCNEETYDVNEESFREDAEFFFKRKYTSKYVDGHAVLIAE